MCQPVCRLALPQQHCLHLQRSQTCAAGLLQAGKKAQRESMVQRELGLPTAFGVCLATGAAHQACRHQTALGRSPPSCHAADQELMLLLSKVPLQHTNCAGENLAESEAFKRNESLQNSTPTNPPSYWQARSICPITIRHTGSSSTNKTRSPAGKGCLWFACSVSFPAAAAAVCSAPLTIVAITQVIVI